MPGRPPWPSSARARVARPPLLLPPHQREKRDHLNLLDHPSKQLRQPHRPSTPSHVRHRAAARSTPPRRGDPPPGHPRLRRVPHRPAQPGRSVSLAPSARVAGSSPRRRATPRPHLRFTDPGPLARSTQSDEVEGNTLPIDGSAFPELLGSKCMAPHASPRAGTPVAPRALSLPEVEEGVDILQKGPFIY